MKFVYFGSAEFSRIVLENLYLAGFKPTLVVSQPDRPKGRGLKVLPAEVSLFALDKKIPLIRPGSLKPAEVTKKLLEPAARFFIVADYGKILPSSILSIPEIFTVGVHPSLLPAYRGASPVNRAIINADKETGVTVFKVNDKMDAGPLILQKKVVIEDSDNAATLTARLAKIGAHLLIEALDRVQSKKYNLTSQDEAAVTLAAKLKKEDGRLVWERDATDIRNLIRGVWGWPGAYTTYKDKIIKIMESEVLDEDAGASPATIVRTDRGGIYVATGKGILKLKILKPEGKKEMDANSFVCGWRVKSGDKFV
ncbi:MAG: methionyl-tRNA formyltransferase [Candidatus Omnitrophota bacterium]|nr:MAG: methionyl-tRNA formyltransferase [Candidatus Omnitrophota bacterium]